MLRGPGRAAACSLLACDLARRAPRAATMARAKGKAPSKVLFYGDVTALRVVIVCIHGLWCAYCMHSGTLFPVRANACAYHLAAHQPRVLAPWGPTHLGPPPLRTLRPLSPRGRRNCRRRRSPCRCCAAARARRGYCRRPVLAVVALPPVLALVAPSPVPCRDCSGSRICARCRCSPCTGCAAARARRSCCRRTPCSSSAAARARRSRCRRSPCTCWPAARARRGRCCRRSPCICCAAARARISCSPCPRSYTRFDGATRLYRSPRRALQLHAKSRQRGACREERSAAAPHCASSGRATHRADASYSTACILI